MSNITIVHLNCDTNGMFLNKHNNDMEFIYACYSTYLVTNSEHLFTNFKNANKAIPKL